MTQTHTSVEGQMKETKGVTEEGFQTIQSAFKLVKGMRHTIMSGTSRNAKLENAVTINKLTSMDLGSS